MYEDKTINYKDCGRDFIFTAGRGIYAEKAFKNEPVRCKDCQGSRKSVNQGKCIQQYVMIVDAKQGSV